MKKFLIVGLMFSVITQLSAQNKEDILRNLENPDTLKQQSAQTSSDKQPMVIVRKIVKVVDGDSIIEERIDTVTSVNALTVDSDNMAWVNTMGDTIKAAKGDTVVVRLGKKKMVIVDSKDKTVIEIPEKGKKSDEIIEYKEVKKFKGHWSGFELGINGFMDKNQSMTQTGDIAWMDLKQARSWNTNINFTQYSIGFGTDKAGLVTGLGLEFNDYHFSNPITLKVENGVTVVDSSYIQAGYKVEKTKITMSHLTLPLLLEFQIPMGEKRKDRIYISAGVIGGVRLGSHTKVVYDDGSRHKDKNRGDFNIATLRYGLTARMGYKGIRLFANYYPVQLFEKGKGPELYPFSVGLVLVPFD
ncbi:outer membrane beta-barrel protein [Tenuifilum sp.]|uniref:outer membrane beta-barrel protein n=1 Tax=Tenuifilum sp. TaxID=2760880 RepID=UPI002CC1FE10|nr:outer membrane beta-barrel protein [Tenuifilum sp.]HOU74780.1 outer membrane beta-barrel protein [Tenuifilum sp.]HQE54976.1 outer membrane beta-barrel protein [Tenuifilum sp.]HQG72975.1 outer membrane beta-barrel protein [Tenuifilum sp.]HQI89589.1 outer membrane beta-barrel protein [Tenuifilum sp.]